MPQFALGGLLQVAEMAWQQDMDLYSSSATWHMHTHHCLPVPLRSLH
jgi:hypothetical protein